MKTKSITLLSIILAAILIIHFSSCVKKEALPEISPLRLNFDNNTNQLKLNIRNAGFATLEWSASANKAWIELGKTSGNLGEEQSEDIIVSVKRDGLSTGVYEGQIDIETNEGSSSVVVYLNHGLFEIKFFNAAYTPVSIRLANDSSGTIEPSGYYYFAFIERPEQIYFNAKTAMYSNNGTRIGREIIWDEIITVDTTVESPMYVLNVSKDYFFLRISNIAENECGPVYINAESQFEMQENIIISPGAMQDIGYYDALKDGEIRIYYNNMEEYNFWLEGEGYFLSEALNQLVLITNTIGIDTLKNCR